MVLYAKPFACQFSMAITLGNKNQISYICFRMNGFSNKIKTLHLAPNMFPGNRKHYNSNSRMFNRLLLRNKSFQYCAAKLRQKVHPMCRYVASLYAKIHLNWGKSILLSFQWNANSLFNLCVPWCARLMILMLDFVRPCNLFHSFFWITCPIVETAVARGELFNRVSLMYWCFFCRVSF